MLCSTQVRPGPCIAGSPVFVMAQPVWQLCQDGNLEGVREALGRGGNVNQCDQQGVTGLMWATHNNFNKVVELLLQQPGVNINQQVPVLLHVPGQFTSFATGRLR